MNKKNDELKRYKFFDKENANFVKLLRNVLSFEMIDKLKREAHQITIKEQT